MSDAARRLDSLEVGSFHRRVVLASGLGWAFDAMDVGLISYIIVVLGQEWGLSPTQRGLVVSIGFAGMFFGALGSGFLSDRFGRRAVFQLTLLVYSVATGLSALAWGLGALLVLRFVVGLGLGGELPVASTLVGELAPARARGRLIVILESFWAYGWIAAAVIGFFVVKNPALGWRWGFAVGALPALYTFVLRRAVPESPRWLASVGRTQEADLAVAAIERENGGPADAPVAGAPSMASAPGPALGARFRELWSARYVKRTVMLWVLWFGIVFSYYGVFTWLPSLLLARGFNINGAFGYVLLITLAQVPGYFSAAWLVERWGRKPTLVTYLLGSALAAWVFGNVMGVAPVLLAGSLLSFFNLGAWGVVYTYTPEQYPTAIRGTGAGAAAAFGRLGAIVGPYLVAWLLDKQGLGLPQSAIFAMFMIAFLVVAIAVASLGEETRGLRLEELASEPVSSARLTGPELAR